MKRDNIIKEVSIVTYYVAIVTALLLRTIAYCIALYDVRNNRHLALLLRTLLLISTKFSVFDF